MYSGFVEGMSCVNETFLFGQVVREMWKALVFARAYVDEVDL
jgi:hypothetical protein